MKKIYCCLYCGRDTRHRSQICGACVAPTTYSSRVDEPDPELEDDYSEESGPDSVCPDNPEDH